MDALAGTDWPARKAAPAKLNHRSRRKCALRITVAGSCCIIRRFAIGLRKAALLGCRGIIDSNCKLGTNATRKIHRNVTIILQPSWPSIEPSRLPCRAIGSARFSVLGSEYLLCAPASRLLYKAGDLRPEWGVRRAGLG